MDDDDDDDISDSEIDEVISMLEAAFKKALRPIEDSFARRSVQRAYLQRAETGGVAAPELPQVTEIRRRLANQRSERRL
jgi:hypothetical protein